MKTLQDMWRICMKDCHSFSDRLKGFVSFCVMLGVLLFVCVSVASVPYVVYRVADHAGYVRHSRTMNITVSGAWLVGEHKDCVSAPSGSIGTDIDCGDSMPEKTMTIQFYGRMSQPEYSVLSWDCRRDEQSFTCWQTGGR